MDTWKKLVLSEIKDLARESGDGLVREPRLRERQRLAPAKARLAALLCDLADAGLVALEEHAVVRITGPGLEALATLERGSGTRPRVR